MMQLNGAVGHHGRHRSHFHRRVRLPACDRITIPCINDDNVLIIALYTHITSSATAREETCHCWLHAPGGSGRRQGPGRSGGPGSVNQSNRPRGLRSSLPSHPCISHLHRSAVSTSPTVRLSSNTFRLQQSSSPPFVPTLTLPFSCSTFTYVRHSSIWLDRQLPAGVAGFL